MSNHQQMSQEQEANLSLGAPTLMVGSMVLDIPGLGRRTGQMVFNPHIYLAGTP